MSGGKIKWKTDEHSLPQISVFFCSRYSEFSKEFQILTNLNFSANHLPDLRQAMHFQQKLLFNKWLVTLEILNINTEQRSVSHLAAIKKLQFGVLQTKLVHRTI